VTEKPNYVINNSPAYKGAKYTQTITVQVMSYFSVATFSVLLNFPDASPVDVALPQQTI